MAGKQNIFELAQRRLQALKSPAFRTQLAQRCAAAAEKATFDCFRESRDPYGEPWKPLKMRAGKPLLDKGDNGGLRGSISAQPGDGWFRLWAAKKYAALHQFGDVIEPVDKKALSWTVRGIKGRFFAKKVTIPARPFFPVEGKGIPPKMAEAFNEEYREHVRETLGLEP